MKNLSEAKKRLLNEKRELNESLAFEELSEHQKEMKELQTSIIDKKLAVMKGVDVPFNPELKKFDLI